jgi:hypothetical protein
MTENNTGSAQNFPPGPLKLQRGHQAPDPGNPAMKSPLTSRWIPSTIDKSAADRDNPIRVNSGVKTFMIRRQL